MELEIWKDIPEYIGYYQISNLGRIRSLDRIINNSSIRNNGKLFIKGKILKASNVCGYLRLVLSKNNKSKGFYVHRLVAISFINNKHNKKEVNHIDGNKKNNNYLNLEWCTSLENTIHAEKNNLRKILNLKRSDVSNIKSKHNRGISAHKLSDQFGVSTSTIYNILHSRNRKSPIWQ